MEPHISIYGLASAIGLGLLIGAVRERAQTDGQRGVAGVRTYLMAALAGLLGAAMGTAVLVAVLALVGVLAVASYWRTSQTDPGLTGEVALVVTALLAALAQTHPAFAAGVAVVVATVLYAKRPLHRLVRESVSEQELQDALLLAGAALVVMPLLPDEPVDPWGVLVPTRLWRVVVLILAVGMAGHLASRVVGARWGLPLAGFLSGFASSTAAVAGFGHRAREEPEHVAPAAAGAMFANLGSLALLSAVVGAASPQLLQAVAPGIAVAGGTLLVVALTGVLRQEGLANLPVAGGARAFRISHALLLASLMAVMLLASVYLRREFGNLGTVAAAAAVALVEVHAAAASLAQLAADGRLELGAGAWGMALLFAVAAGAKTVLAFVSGGRSYGWRIAMGLVGSALAFAVALGVAPGP